MAAEQGLSVDEAGFRRLMDEQRERAKADAAAKKGAAPRRARLPRGGRLARPRGGVHRLRDRSSARARSRGLVARRRRGDHGRARATSVELVLDRTPFYAEGGGQLADQGVIELDNGARLEVRDVQSPITGLVVHQARVLDGEVTPRRHAHALVDVERRRVDLARRTPRRTWCTRRSARRWARPRPRRAPRTRRAGSGSTSRPPARCPTSVMEDVEARVNDLVLADLAVARAS